MAKKDEALEYVKNNSRLVKRVNVFTPEEAYDNGPNVFEHRLTLNGKPFILHDFGASGWDMYYLHETIRIDQTINVFNEVSGIPHKYEDIFKQQSV